jgi:predicted acetyltransferase
MTGPRRDDHSIRPRDPEARAIGCGEAGIRQPPALGAVAWGMTITVTPATPDEEPVVRNLTQLYAYDFAEIMGWHIPDSGRFPDQSVDGCFEGLRRHAFIVRVDGRLAGFAIVDTCSRLTGDDGVHDVAEFFVVRPYRGRGVGAEAARTLFDRFGGRWEVRQTAKNVAATAFWRKVIGRYTGERYEERMLDGPRWRGPVQAFACP